MKTFFKELGISLVPVILALLAAIAMRLIMDSAFRVLHPSIFSNEVYECCVSAMWYVVLSSIVVYWVFIPLMAWRKRKIIAWRLADLEKEDGGNHSSGDEKDNNGSSDTTDKETVNVQICPMRQKWYRTIRFIFCANIKDMTFGSVQMDIPTEDEKEFEPFWRDCDAFIYALCVDNVARKHGVGGSLLFAVENQAKIEGCKTVALRWDDRESEPWVLDWYKRKGYKETKIEGDGHSHFLVKQLGKSETGGPSNDDEEPSGSDNNAADE